VKYLVPAAAFAAILAVVPVSATPAPAPAAQNNATSNDALVAKVKEQIASDTEFKDSQIDVNAVGGDVTLTGVASSAAVRMKIFDKTKATEGVTKVVNKVTVAKAKK